MSANGVNKYGVDPKFLQGQRDIVSHVIALGDRIASQEQALKAGHTAIEDGDFIVRNGNILVSESDDTVVLRIKHGEVPEINMWPLGDTDTHQVTMLGYDDALGSQAIVTLVETTPGLVPDGGKVLLAREYALFSHQPNGGNESFIWLNSQQGITEEIALYRGRWSDQSQYDSNMGLYMGAFTASSGVSTWTHTYFTPFSTTIAPLFTVGISGGTVTWGIDSYSTSSFVIRFGATGSNKFVTFWNFRL